MKKHISSTVFIKSIDGTDPILFHKPQIAFLGRSNVGKSSLINMLMGTKLAQSSTNPGKTVRIGFFLINNVFYFSDLPGYGFANVSKEQQEHFRKLIAWYLFSSSAPIKLIVLIIDAKVGLTDFDYESIDLLTQYDKPFVIVANKIDKIKSSNRDKTLSQLKSSCHPHVIIPVSTLNSEGKQQLLHTIFEHLK